MTAVVTENKMCVNISGNIVVSLFSVSLCNSVRCLNVQKYQGSPEENNIPVASIAFCIFYISGLFYFLHMQTHMPLHIYIGIWGEQGESYCLIHNLFCPLTYFCRPTFIHSILVKLLEGNISNIVRGRSFNCMFINESHRKQISL